MQKVKDISALYKLCGIDVNLSNDVKERFDIKKINNKLNLGNLQRKCTSKTHWTNITMREVK